MYHYRFFRTLLTAALISPLILLSNPSSAAVFVHDSQLIQADSAGTTRPVTITPARSLTPHALPVSQYWGTYGDHLLVSLEGDHARALAEEQDHHCSDHDAGLATWLLHENGTLDSLVCDNVLRAYPGPAHSGIALISPDRDLSLWKDDRQTTISMPGKVSNVGWSPDGRYLVASCYPPDWSVGAVSSASTTAEFLRLQNADLYLLDVATLSVVTRLTDDPGTEYGAFFSPDGTALYYTWLHITEDLGGLMCVTLDRDNGTSASAPAVRLTTAGNDPGEIPLGRVGTYLWQDGAQRLVFESGLPDGSGEIWTMTRDGHTPRKLGAGRKPQPAANNSVLYLETGGAVKALQEGDIR